MSGPEFLVLFEVQLLVVVEQPTAMEPQVAGWSERCQPLASQSLVRAVAIPEEEEWEVEEETYTVNRSLHSKTYSQPGVDQVSVRGKWRVPQLPDGTPRPLGAPLGSEPGL